MLRRSRQNNASQSLYTGVFIRSLAYQHAEIQDEQSFITYRAAYQQALADQWTIKEIIQKPNPNKTDDDEPDYIHQIRTISDLQNCSYEEALNELGQYEFSQTSMGFKKVHPDKDELANTYYKTHGHQNGYAFTSSNVPTLTQNGVIVVDGDFPPNEEDLVQDALKKSQEPQNTQNSGSLMRNEFTTSAQGLMHVQDASMRPVSAKDIEILRQGSHALLARANHFKNIDYKILIRTNSRFKEKFNAFCEGNTDFKENFKFISFHDNRIIKEYCKNLVITVEYFTAAAIANRIDTEYRCSENSKLLESRKFLANVVKKSECPAQTKAEIDAFCANPSSASVEACVKSLGQKIDQFCDELSKMLRFEEDGQTTTQSAARRKPKCGRLTIV